MIWECSNGVSLHARWIFIRAECVMGRAVHARCLCWLTSSTCNRICSVKAKWMIFYLFFFFDQSSFPHSLWFMDLYTCRSMFVCIRAHKSRQTMATANDCTMQGILSEKGRDKRCHVFVFAYSYVCVCVVEKNGIIIRVLAERTREIFFISSFLIFFLFVGSDAWSHVYNKHDPIHVSTIYYLPKRK